MTDHRPSSTTLQRTRRARTDADLEPSAARRTWLGLRARAANTFALDLRSLALFRALLGATLFFHLCGWLGDAQAFLSDAGVLPRSTLGGSTSLWRISVHAANGQTGFEVLLLLAGLAAAVALFIGWRTRLAAIVSWILYVSLLNRAPTLVTGGDMLLAALLFWCCFVPANARWSLDAALADGSHHTVQTPRSWATAALLLQAALACVLTTWLATGADPLGQMLNQPAYLTPAGDWLVQHALLAPWMHAAVRWIGVLAPWMLFAPILPKVIRPSAWAALVAVQIAAMTVFDLGVGPWVTLVALSAFVSTHRWEQMARAAARRPSLRIYHDAQQPQSRRWQNLWCMLLILPHAELRAVQDEARTVTLFDANRTWIVIDADDRAHLGSAAWLAMLRRSPLLGVLGALLIKLRADIPLEWLRRAARLRGISLPAAHPPLYFPPRTADRICGAVLVLVVAWNLACAAGPVNAVTNTLAPPLRVLRLDQHWARYLPHGPTLRGWIAAFGHTTSGARVDALHERRNGDFTQPAHPASRHDDIHWHTWDDALLGADAEAVRARYARHLCRRWNARAASGEHLQSLSLVHIVENSRAALPGGNTLEQRVLWSGSCAPQPSSAADDGGGDQPPPDAHE